MLRTAEDALDAAERQRRTAATERKELEARLEAEEAARTDQVRFEMRLIFRECKCATFAQAIARVP